MKRDQYILITGVYGYIGRNLYEKLLAKKFKVYGIGRKKKNQTKLHNCLNLKINQKNLNQLKINPNIIIHCAGSGSVKESELNPKEDYANNIISTKNIINFIVKKKYKIHLIYLSSAAVYGEKRKSLLKPISVYGKHKLLSEKLILSHKSSLITYSILRIFSIFGVGLKKQLIWDICNKIKKKEYKYSGSGDEKRSWLSINELSKYILKTIKNKNKSSVEDVSGNFSIKNKEVINFMHKISNFKIKPIFNNITRKGDPKFLTPYSYSNKKKINFSKKDFFRELRKYSNWFNENF